MSEHTRILVITARLDVGGTELHLLQILPRLREHGYQVEVFVLQKGGALTPDFEKNRIRVHEPRSNYKWPFGVVQVVVSLVRHLIHNRYDIVHYFLPAAYVIGAGCSLVSTRAIRIMSRRSLNRYQKKSTWIRTVERMLHPFMFRIAGNSRAVLNELKAEGVKEGSLVLIYNGISVFPPIEPAQRFSTRERYGADDGSLVLICIANLFHYKGHREVLEGLALAADALGDNWQVWFAGRDTGLGEELRQVAEALSISAHVRWLGECRDVQTLLQSADIGLQCSTEEGFSNAVLEAMAARLPLVATSVGGNPDVVVDSETGFLVPVAMPRAISEAIARLAASESLRKQYGEAGRQRVAEHFSIENVLEGYRALYQSATRQCPTPPGHL